MEIIKRFQYEIDKKNITIKIKEKLEAQYSSYVWPSAPVLSYFLLYQKLQLKNKKLLEIGCGTGLPGIVAYFLSANVTFTDNASSINTIHESLQLNDIKDSKVQILEWGVFNSDIFNLGIFDLIIASDCFYDSKDFEPIIATIAYFFSINKAAQFWTTYEIRNTSRSIEHLLLKWEMECKSIALESFLPANYIEDQTHMPTIMMLIIKQKK